MKNATISGAKTRARLLIDHMAKSGTKFTMPDALEAISASENNSDWNRYQAALKSSRNAPEAAPASIPHTVLASHPGLGASAIIEALLAFDMEKADSIPLHIVFYAHDFPTAQSVDRSKIVTLKSRHGAILQLATISPEKAGAIVIYLCAETGIGLEGQEKRAAHSKELESVLKGIEGWDPAVLAQIGRVTISGFEATENLNSKFYSSVFPKFMRSIRQYGANKTLLIHTMSDLSQHDLYSSTDEYDVITMSGGYISLFPTSPIPVTRIIQHSGNFRRTYGRIFQDEKRAIHDAALYIGTHGESFYKQPLPRETSYSLFLQQFMLKLISEGAQKRESEKPEHGGIVSIWFNKPGIDLRTVRSLASPQSVLTSETFLSSQSVKFAVIEIVDKAVKNKAWKCLKDYCKDHGIEMKMLHQEQMSPSTQINDPDDSELAEYL